MFEHSSERQNRKRKACPAAIQDPPPAAVNAWPSSSSSASSPEPVPGHTREPLETFPCRIEGCLGLQFYKTKAACNRHMMECHELPADSELLYPTSKRPGARPTKFPSPPRNGPRFRSRVARQRSSKGPRPRLRPRTPPAPRNGNLEELIVKRLAVEIAAGPKFDRVMDQDPQIMRNADASPPPPPPDASCPRRAPAPSIRKRVDAEYEIEAKERYLEQCASIYCEDCSLPNIDWTWTGHQGCQCQGVQTEARQSRGV